MNCQAVLQRVCSILHSHRHMKLLILSHPYQHLLVSIFFIMTILSVKWYLIVVLYYLAFYLPLSFFSPAPISCPLAPTVPCACRQLLEHSGHRVSPVHALDSPTRSKLLEHRLPLAHVLGHPSHCSAHSSHFRTVC